jgi:hypothetical protein
MEVLEQTIQQPMLSPPGMAEVGTTGLSLPEQISLPFDLLFGSPGNLRLRFKQPLRLRVYKEEETIVAYSKDLSEFGYGDSLGEALIDFERTLGELYWELSSNVERLGADLAQQFHRVCEYLDERPLPKPATA